MHSRSSLLNTHILDGVSIANFQLTKHGHVIAYGLLDQIRPPNLGKTIMKATLKSLLSSVIRWVMSLTAVCKLYENHLQISKHWHRMPSHHTSSLLMALSTIGGINASSSNEANMGTIFFSPNIRKSKADCLTLFKRLCLAGTEWGKSALAEIRSICDHKVQKWLL